MKMSQVDDAADKYLSVEESSSSADLEEEKKQENKITEDEGSDSDGQEDDSVGEEDEGGESQLDVVDRYWPPPVEKSVRLIGSASGKMVSAFAFNESGTRFATGGHDNEVKIWDFGAINVSRPVPNGTAHPSSGAVINHLEFAHDNELILVIPGSCQAIIMAKDGIVDQKDGVCSKGDQYISDMANTKGHAQMLNYGCWRPKDTSEFITCSNDSTIRIWNSFKLSQQKTVIKTRSPSGGLKTVPTICKYSRDALSIAAGCQDGSVLMWDTRRKFISTSSCIKNAHLKGSEISGLEFSYDMTKLVTRSEDESCKLWDLRQLKNQKPLGSRNGLATIYSVADCCFSPDDRLIMLGTAGSKQQLGEVIFMDSSSGNLETRSGLELVGGASVLRVRWHPKINHLAYTSSDGQVHVTYDSRRSLGGGFMQLASCSSSSSHQRQAAGSLPSVAYHHDQAGGRRRKKKFAYGAEIVVASVGRPAEAAASTTISSSSSSFSHWPSSSSAAATHASSQAAIKKKIITPHALPLFCVDGDSASQTTTAATTGKSEASSSRSAGNVRHSAAGPASSTALAGTSKRHNTPNRSYKPQVPKSASQGVSGVKPAGSTLSSYIARSIAKP